VRKGFKNTDQVSVPASFVWMTSKQVRYYWS